MKITLLNIFNDKIIPDEKFPDYGTLLCFMHFKNSYTSVHTYDNQLIATVL